MRRRQLAKLYDTFYEPIYRFIYFRVGSKEIGEDLAADVFLKFWKYAKEKGKVDNERALLYKISRTLVVDFYRKKKEVSLDEGDGESKDDDSKLLDLQKALSELDSVQREVVVLHYFEGFSLREVGEILERKENSVQVIAHRARAKLKDKL